MDQSPSRTQLQAEIEILQQRLRSLQDENSEVLQIQRAESMAMMHMVTALAKSTNLDQGISIMLVNLRELVPFDLAGLFLLSKGNRLIERSFGLSPSRIHTIPDNHPLVAQLETSKEPLILSGLQDDQRFKDWVDMQPIRTWMGLPIRLGNEMVAFLSLGSLQEKAYRQSDARRASIFIRPFAELFELAQEPGMGMRLSGNLEVISHLSLALGQVESREETLKTILSQVSRLFDPAQGVILFPDQQSESLELNFSLDDTLLGLRHPRQQLPAPVPAARQPASFKFIDEDIIWQAFDSGEIRFLQDPQEFLDGNEQPFYRALLEGKSSVVFIPLTVNGETFAELIITFPQQVDFSPEDKRMVELIAQLTSATFQRMLNLEALEMELSEERNRLIEQTEQTAVMEERQRLARELHDSVTQLIYSQVLFAGAGLKVLRSGDVTLSKEYLERIHSVAQQALKEMRLLVFELRPQDGLEDGLIPALQRRLDAVERRSDLKVRFEWVGNPELEETTEVALYYISMEALNNVLKHSQATEIEISLRLVDGQLRYELRDNGVGFDPETALQGGGMGLISMNERAVAAGGKLEVITKPGEGTRLVVIIEEKR